MNYRTSFLSRRNLRAYIAAFISYLMLVGQVAPLALAANGPAMRPAPLNTGGAGAAETQDLKAVPAPAALALPAPAITASKTDNIAAATAVNPGDQINYMVTVGNSGTDASNVQFSDTIDPNTTLFGSATMSPLARADSYNATLNTQLVVAAPQGVLVNDSGIPAPTAATLTNVTTTSGGTVNLASDGSFTYTPPNNFQGSDTFTYTAQNSSPEVDSALVTIVVDAPPTVTATTPVNGATGVALNSNVTVTFSEAVTAPSSAFTISCANSGSHAFALSNVSNTFTLNPTADFTNNELCTVTVVAANVTDNDTNDPPNNMAADYVFTFTTVDTAPSVTTTSPVNGATNVASNTNITINFSESVNATTSSFMIECPAPGNTQAFTLSSSPSTSFTLNPTSDLPVGVICTVTVVAANVTDADTNDPPDNMAADFSFTFTVDSPPSVTTTTPANNATGVAASTNITVNFSESVNATTSSFKIECPAPGNTQAFTLSSSPSTSFTLNPTSDLPVGVICTVTVIANQITDADAGDPPDNLTADYVFSFSIPPDAVDDSHAATGNIPFNASTKLLANDIGPGITVTAIPGCADVTAPFDCATVRGGSVSVAADGTYSYNPPAGYEGADSITYTITNAAGSDTASINLSISGMLWFIDDSATTCTANTIASNCGRLTNPFSTLAAFEAANGNATPLNNGNVIAPQANEHIFLYSGSYTGPLTLENNQRLVGQGATASFSAISGVTPVADSVALPATGGTNPTITSGGVGITLAQGNTLRGFTIGNTTGAKISGNNFGTLTAGNSTSPDLLLNGSGQALNLTTGTFAATSRFNSVTTTSSTAQGINLSGVAGSVNFGDTSVSGSAGTGVALATVSAALTFADLDISPNANQRGLHATSQTGAITTTSGTIATSGGVAVEIVGTSTASRAPLNIQFTTINSSGGTNGIVLTNTSQTGSPGGFNILSTTSGTCGGVANPGTPGQTPAPAGTLPTTADCTGGQIQTSTGATGSNSGIGILLTDVEKVSLTRMRVNGHSNFGLKGTRVNGFILTSSYFHNNGDDVGGDGEGNIYFYELTGGSGANSVTNSYLDLGAARNFHVLNTSGTLDRLTISGTTIGNDGTSGSDGIFLQADNSANTGNALTLKATIQNGRFNGSRGDGIQLSARGTSVTDLVFTGNRMTNNHPNQVSGSTAVTISAGGSAGSFNPTCTYNVSNNTINNNSANNGSGNAIAIGKGGVSSDASFVGTISGNVIGTTGVDKSGGAQGGGIVVDIVGGGVHNSTITNNVIRQYSNNGILAQSGGTTAGGGQGNLIVDIRGNLVAEPSSAALVGAFNGIRVVLGTNSGDNSNNCVTIGGTAAADKNTINGTGTGGAADLRLFQRFNTILAVPGYAGGATDDTAMSNFLAARNNVTTIDADHNASPGYSGTCTAPLSAPETSGLESDPSAVRRKVEIMTGSTPAANPATPVEAPAAPEAEAPAPAPAPARVWSDMPIIITRTPRSDSAKDEDSAKDDKDEDAAKDDEDSVKDDEDAAKDGDADTSTSSDDSAAPKKAKKAKKPTRTKKAADEQQPENRNISYLGPLGSAPSRATRFAPASYVVGDAVRTSNAPVGDAVVTPARNAPAIRTLKAAPARAVAAPFAGETVNVNIGILPANKTVKIRFTVTVNTPFPGAATQVSNQGTVSFTGGSVQTDDPDAGGANDPTVTLVNNTRQITVHDAKAAEPTSGTTDMIFTVSLSSPATSTVTVDFTTADDSGGANPATAGTDYTTTTGTVTFTTGQQVKTIAVPILSDTDGAETDETFLVNLSNASSGSAIQDGQAVGTITQDGATAGTFIISELRTSGPAGTADEFVEFYNNTNTPLTITASDASAGYGLFKMGATCADSPVLLGTIPSGTVIPARGHYLMVGSAYSLANYGGTGAAAGNLTMSSDIGDDNNVGVFSTADPAGISSINRLDAVGFGVNVGNTCTLLKEGTNLAAVSGSTKEYTFFRDMRQASGGNPKDTNDNGVDFLYADTAPDMSGTQRLGAPGPENLASPIRRDTSGIALPLIDGSVPSQAVPNRLRTGGMGDPNTSTFGTLSIRRRVQNNTGAPVTRLRFRIVQMTSYPVVTPGQADLRAITSSPVVISGITDVNTCASTGTPTTTPCQVTAQATTLETPPAQPSGGGYNSTLSVSIPSGLANGASIDVNFTLGVQTTGTFRFLIIVEALP